MCAVLGSPLHSFRPDFAQVVSRIFEHGRFLIVGKASEELRQQFAAIRREAVACELYPDLEQKLSGEPDFQVAIWLCTEEEEDDCRVAEELSRCASEILLIADAGVDVANRRSEAEFPLKVLLLTVSVALP